jgi:hypothetical protein
MDIARILILGLGVFGATAALAQVPKAHQPMSAALRTFSQAYPQCAGWTDWRQFCSRTGPNGEDYCLTDPAMPVKPSAVFCAVSSASAIDKNKGYRNLRPRSRSSYRYIKKIESGGTYPFDGTRMASRNHPWCRAWEAESLTTKANLSTYCVKNATGKSLLCETEVSSDFSAKIPLMCVDWQVPQWCFTADSMTSTYDQSDVKLPPGEEIITLGEDAPLAYGIICARRK